MPAAIPLLGSLATSAAFGAVFASATTAFTIGGFAITNGLIGQALGGIVSLGLSSLTSPKAKSVSGGSSGGSDVNYPFLNNGTKTNVRNTIAFMELAYGQVRKSGTIIFEAISSSGTDNLGAVKSGLAVYLNQLIVFAAHECDSFVGLYLDDQLLTIDANGWVTNAAYSSNSDTFTTKPATSFSALGDAQTATGSGTSASITIATAYATATGLIGIGDLVTIAGIANSAYNGSFVITSIASSNAGLSTQINYTTDTTITSTGLSQASLTVKINQIGYRGTTAYMYDSTNHGLIAGDTVYVSLASPAIFNVDRGSVLSVPSVRTFTYVVPSTPTQVSISGQYQRRNGTDEYLVNIVKFTGAPGQTIGGSSLITTLLPGQFVSTDVGNGLCCAFVRFYNSAKFSSQPQLTAEIKGAKCYDPRSGARAWSNNAAIVIMDYLTRTIGNTNTPVSLGLNYNNVANTSTDLDLTNFSQAANICDEQVQLLDSTYDARYTIDGAVSLGDNPIDILSLMVPSTGGIFTYFDWKAKLFPAEYSASTAYIDQKWMTSSLQLVATNDAQTLTNTVRGIFNDQAQKYYSSDIPVYTDATALIQDNNKVFPEDLQLPYVKNTEKAQRLAKLYLKQKRAARNQFTVKLNPSGATLAPYDTVTVNYPRLAINSQTFKVLGHTEGLLGEGVSVILRPEDPAYYSWSASEATL